MKILVTGANSGLGKYLCELFSAVPFTRQDFKSFNYNQDVDLVIHCAFNVSKNIKSSEFSGYIEDNLLLTKKLLNLKYKKFVFISSIDVYPKSNEIHTESEDFICDKIEGLYGLFKVISEKLAINSAKDYLILRPTALLGRYCRKNSLIKILSEETPSLTLTPDSEFNYILYEDIFKFIKNAQEKNISGIFNICANDNITLAEIVKKFTPNKKIRFGNYKYSCGKISNLNSVKLLTELDKTSIKNIELALDNGLLEAHL